MAIEAVRYQNARNKKKGMILHEFTELTGYGRKYAVHVLRRHTRNVTIITNCVIQGEVGRMAKTKKPWVCDAVEDALEKIWYVMDCVFGKRLDPVLRKIVTRRELFREIKLSGEVRDKLFKISPAPIDRLLASEWNKHHLKGGANTKPGTPIKNQIPTRTFSDLNEQKPGLAEIDLVGHGAGNSQGEFVRTLGITNVCSTRSET